jgi:hypothetical protein
MSRHTPSGKDNTIANMAALLSVVRRKLLSPRSRSFGDISRYQPVVYPATGTLSGHWKLSRPLWLARTFAQFSCQPVKHNREFGFRFAPSPLVILKYRAFFMPLTVGF